MNMLTQEKDMIEILLDKYGMETVLDVLAQICFEKSEHLLSNWQAPNDAKAWQTCGIKLDHVKISKPINAVVNALNSFNKER